MPYTFRLPYTKTEARCLEPGCGWSHFTTVNIYPVRNSWGKKNALKHSRTYKHEVEVSTTIRYKAD